MNNCYQDPTATMPGTIFKIYIPAGAVINVLNLLEVSSPEGISLVVRLPILAGTSAFAGLRDTIMQAGGSIVPMATGNYPAHSYPTNYMAGCNYPAFGTSYMY